MWSQVCAAGYRVCASISSVRIIVGRMSTSISSVRRMSIIVGRMSTIIVAAMSTDIVSTISTNKVDMHKVGSTEY